MGQESNDDCKIFFYLPSYSLIKKLPSDINDYWEFINKFVAKNPIHLPDGRGVCKHLGPYNWTVQTYLYLMSNGYPCELIDSLEVEGVVISHGDFLPTVVVPSAKRFIVEIKPDRSLRSIFSNYAIVQNDHDPILIGWRHLFISASKIEYWPQPGLIPRNKTRLQRIENVCFMGKPEQFMSDVNSLSLGIKQLGLKWKMVSKEKWHDYSEVDVIVAVRENNSGAPSNLSLSKKPSSKLKNAWLAGVPAILSPEPAYLDLKLTHFDFLSASNTNEILNQLNLLISTPRLYQKMVNNGEVRISRHNSESVVREWIVLIDEVIMPAYISWSKSKFRRGLLLTVRLFFYPKAFRYLANILIAKNNQSNKVKK